MQWPRLDLNLEGTPVALAAMATFGIVAVCLCPIEPETRSQAIQALGGLAGGASGMAIPQSIRRVRDAAKDNEDEFFQV